MAKLNYEGLVDNKLYHTIEYAEKRGLSMDTVTEMFNRNIDIVYDPARLHILREQEVDD